MAKPQLGLKQKIFLLCIEAAAQGTCPAHISPHPGKVWEGSITSPWTAGPGQCHLLPVLRGSQLSLGLEAQIRLLCGIYETITSLLCFIKVSMWFL